MKVFTFECEDGSVWGVPVEVIARNRAAQYAHEFGGDIERSMEEDTMPLFDSDNYEIEDWAVSNMNFADVAHVTFLISKPPKQDFQTAWIGGEKRVIDVIERS